ncbi:MAG: STAS domain-containing protein [Chitinophagaceae bacterium]|nr:STAS domain-containing protein [Chitinophagaceae bacterium]
MLVKIDTREKFHVITIHEAVLAANMTEKMDRTILTLLDDNVKNTIVNMKDIKMVEKAAADQLVKLHDSFYDINASFVVCELQPDVKKAFESSGILEKLNYTPTESEAMDMVQMEEIEREFGES